MVGIYFHPRCCGCARQPRAGRSISGRGNECIKLSARANIFVTSQYHCTLSNPINFLPSQWQRKLGSDLEQFEALETLANQLGDSLQFGGATTGQQQLASSEVGLSARVAPRASKAQQVPAVATNQKGGKTGGQPQPQPPPPCPPKVSKWQLYESERADEVFKDVDARAINIAQEDQQTFTDLVHHLTRHCLTDIEKARAIFRWITVKNLNTMQFDPSIKPDTPFGLLRGIKQGSESYHVLFKRLCR